MLVLVGGVGQGVLASCVGQADDGHRQEPRRPAETPIDRRERISVSAPEYIVQRYWRCGAMCGGTAPWGLAGRRFATAAPADEINRCVSVADTSGWAVEGSGLCYIARIAPGLCADFVVWRGSRIVGIIPFSTGREESSPSRLLFVRIRVQGRPSMILIGACLPRQSACRRAEG